VAERTHFSTSLAQLAAQATSQGKAIAADPARGGPLPFSYEAHFLLNLKVLGTLVPRLFAGNRPDFRAMKQGAIGDCYFFSLTTCPLPESQSDLEQYPSAASPAINRAAAGRS